MPDNRVFMDDENTRIRITIEGFSLYASELDQIGQEGLYLRTSLTRAGFPETLVPFNHRSCSVITKPNLTEIRYELTVYDLRSLNLLLYSGSPDLSVYSVLDYNAGAPSKKKLSNEAKSNSNGESQEDRELPRSTDLLRKEQNVEIVVTKTVPSNPFWCLGIGLILGFFLAILLVRIRQSK